MDRGHYLVVGLGKTGHSIARYLQKCGASFVVFDTRETTDALEPFRKDFRMSSARSFGTDGNDYGHEW